MGNIKLPQGHKRNPENHLSWLGEIPALFSLSVTHAWNMRRNRQEKEMRDLVRSWSGGRSGESTPRRQECRPGDTPKAASTEIKGSEWRPGKSSYVLTWLFMWTQLDPFPKVSVRVDGERENSFFPSLLYPHFLSSELTCLSNGKTLAAWMHKTNQRKVAFKKMRGSPPS